MTTTGLGSGERADLLEALRTQRYLFLHTVDGLTDEQAAERPTVSELCLGGLVKHVAGCRAVVRLHRARAGRRWETSASRTTPTGSG